MRTPILATLLTLAAVLLARAQTGPNTPKEPLAPKWSAARAAEFLDHAAVTWTQKRKCATCHTNVAYLMARPQVVGGLPDAAKEVRSFFEQRVIDWRKNGPKYPTEAVIVAAALAFNDAHTTNKLHPTTREALDRMWQEQEVDGSWSWIKCEWPPLEHDDYYGVVFAALGVGIAPDKYADTDKAKAGLAKVRQYLAKNPAPDAHHRAYLLWAAQRVDGLLNAKEKQAVIAELRKLQRADGGWSLPTLGVYQRRDKTANDKDAPSDGYATGLVVYVLRQAGVDARDDAVQRGVTWLKANQRESGRWFTRSLNTDSYHYISHTGTAFAVMALRACE